MPKELEHRLRKMALKKFRGHTKASEKRRDAYVYGTMRKTGWKPKGEK